MQGQVILQVLGLLLDVMEALVQVLLEVLVKVVVKVKEFVVKVDEVFLSSLSSTSFPRTTPSTRPAGRVWAWILRVWVFSLRPLHPAGVVLDPFPETRPLAELGTASARGGQRDHPLLIRSRVAICVAEISPAA